MMKYLLVVSLAFTSLSVSAQIADENKGGFSIGGEFAIPVQKPKNPYPSAIGGSLQGEIKVAKKAGISLNAGYIYYGENHLHISHQAWVLAGARYYFYKKAYINAQAGPGLGRSDDFIIAYLYYGPGIGIKFSVFDATLNYMRIGTGDYRLSTLGLRVGVVL